MVRRDEIDVMHIPHLLQFQHPVRKLFGCEIKALPLVRDVVILAKDATQTTTAEENTS